MYRTIIALLVFIVLPINAAQSELKLNISGKVVDSVGNPVKDAVLRLTVSGISDTTDQNGDYILTNIPSGILIRHSQKAHLTPQIIGNFLHFAVTDPSQSIVVTAFMLSGKSVGKICLTGLVPGAYSTDLVSSLHIQSNGTYIVQIRSAGKLLQTIRLLCLDRKIQADNKTGLLTAFDKDQSAIQATLPALDTIVLTKPGYRMKRKPVYNSDFEYTLNFELVKNKIPFFRTTPDQLQYWAFTGEPYQVIIDNYDDDDHSNIDLKLISSNSDSMSFINQPGNLDTLTWLPGQADTGLKIFTFKVSDSNGGSDTLSWSIRVFSGSGSWNIVGKQGISIDTSRNVLLDSWNGIPYCAFVERDTTPHFRLDTVYKPVYDSTGKDTSKEILRIDTIRQYIDRASVMQLAGDQWEYLGKSGIKEDSSSLLHIYDMTFNSDGLPYISVNSMSKIFTVVKYSRETLSWTDLSSDTALFPSNQLLVGPEIGFVNNNLRAYFWGQDTGSVVNSDISEKLFIKQWNGSEWVQISKTVLGGSSMQFSSDDLSDDLLFNLKGESFRAASYSNQLRVYKNLGDSIVNFLPDSDVSTPSTATLTSIIQYADTTFVAYTQNGVSTVLSIHDTISDTTGTFIRDKWNVIQLEHDSSGLYALMIKDSSSTSKYAFQIRKFTDNRWFPVFGGTIKNLSFAPKPAYGSIRNNIVLRIINGVPFIAHADASVKNKITVIRYQR